MDEVLRPLADVLGVTQDVAGGENLVFFGFESFLTLVIGLLFCLYICSRKRMNTYFVGYLPFMGIDMCLYILMLRKGAHILCIAKTSFGKIFGCRLSGCVSSRHPDCVGGRVADDHRILCDVEAIGQERGRYGRPVGVWEDESFRKDHRRQGCGNIHVYHAE